MIRRSETVYRPSSPSKTNDVSVASPESARSRSSAVATLTWTDSTCCPSNASSSLTRSPSATAHELREDAAGRVGVHERHLEAEQPAPRRLVDQLGPACGKPVELASDVVDLEGDVVHPRPALGEKLPDRRLRPERRQQLDAILADPERGRLDALVGDRVAMLELSAEEPRVRVDGGVEVANGDAQVVDALHGHRADEIGRA